MSRIHRLTTAAGTVLTVAALAASPAWAQSQDLRSPDARDAAGLAAAAGSSSGTGDARGGSVIASDDHRSPDARAAGEGSTPVVVQVQAEPDTGLSWDSAAIGALAAAGLLISLAGATALVSRRRTRPAV